MESLQETKPGPKRSKFGFGRLQAIKKSIRGSFGILFKSHGERLTHSYTSPIVEPQRQEIDMEKSLPCFTSVMEFSLRSPDIGVTERGADWNSRQTSQLETFKPETDVAPAHSSHCQSGPPRFENNLTIYSRVESIDSLDYKTVPEREPRSTDSAPECPVFAEPVIYTEPLKNAIQNNCSNTLPLPPSLSSRRNSPIYETVAPAYPPKNYDQQKEHADIVPHLIDTDLVQNGDIQPVALSKVRICANIPEMIPRNSAPLVHTKNEPASNEWVVDYGKPVDCPNEITQDTFASSSCPQIQIARALQETISMKDQATQTDFELFEVNGNWHPIISEHANGTKTTVEAATSTTEDAGESRHFPLHFVQPSFDVHEDSRCCIKVTEAQISNKDNYQDNLSNKKTCPNRGSLNNLVLESELTADGNMDKKSQRPRMVDMIKFNTVPAFKLGSNTQFLSPSSAGTTRVSADDTRSIFSSEGAESDFAFYPCETSASLDAKSPSALVGGRNTPNVNQARSYSCACGDNYPLSQGDDSSRSDFYGSSLDEVTRQFFLDDDVLSDDVFMSETEQYNYPSWKYQKDASPRTLHSIEENSQHQPECGQPKPFYNAQGICFGEWGAELWHAYLQKNNKSSWNPHDCVIESHNSGSSVRSDETYAYKYDDIDEVLKNFRDLSASSYPSRSENDTEVTDLSDSDVSIKDVSDHHVHDIESLDVEKADEECERTDPPLSQNQDFNKLPEWSQNQNVNKLPERPRSLRFSSGCYEEIDSEFADVFDSLRKNSLQFKSRQMWRKRRINRKRGVLEAAQNGTFINEDTCPNTILNGFETPSDTVGTQNAHPPSNSNSRGNHGCSQKPLRGILKKTVLIQPISIAERNLCNFDREIKTIQCKGHIQRRRAKSLGLEVYPLEKTEAMYGKEILDTQYKVAKAHSPQSPVNAPAFNTIIDQAGSARRVRRSHSLPTGSHNWFRDYYRCETRPKDSLSSPREIKPIIRQFQSPSIEGSKTPTSTTLPEATSHLVNRAGGPIVHRSNCALNNNNLTDIDIKNGNNNTKMFVCSGQPRSCTQRQRTNNDNLRPFLCPAVERQRDFMTVRKNSLDLYRWNSCVHRRRKAPDRRVDRHVPGGNSVRLQRTITICPSERPTATL